MCIVVDGEQKFCDSVDGAKFSDHKFIVVDRIVVQYIVFLKLSRVVDKIVVDGKISDADVRIVDDIFQINGVVVVCARINAFWIHGFLSFQSCENVWRSICEKSLFCT